MRPSRRALAVPLAGLVWSAWRAHGNDVSGSEERVFRAFNAAPDGLAPFLWPVMQMGSLGAVYVVAADQYRREGRAQAIAVAATGTAVWGGIKLIKPIVGRGRPVDHLERVRVRGRGQSGLGYPSGHAAVSLTLALSASVNARDRRLAVLGAAVTAVSRMYVGAHLPLDVVGGASAGWLVGAMTAR
jgi:membrane-associated phospholipid phosphatase